MGRTATRNVSVSQLEGQAAALWSELKPGSVVWLTGDLGTGKTTFVKALVRAASGPFGPFDEQESSGAQQTGKVQVQRLAGILQPVTIHMDDHT